MPEKSSSLVYTGRGRSDMRATFTVRKGIKPSGHTGIPTGLNYEWFFTHVTKAIRTGQRPPRLK